MDMIDRVTCVGDPVIDILAASTYDDLKRLNLEAGGCTTSSSLEQQNLLQDLQTNTSVNRSGLYYMYLNFHLW